MFSCLQLACRHLVCVSESGGGTEAQRGADDGGGATAGGDVPTPGHPGLPPQHRPVSAARTPQPLLHTGRDVTVPADHGGGGGRPFGGQSLLSLASLQASDVLLLGQ